MTELDDLEIDVKGDSEAVWSECRRCEAVITEYWQPEADLVRLVQDAQDHVCGMEVTD